MNRLLIAFLFVVLISSMVVGQIGTDTSYLVRLGVLHEQANNLYQRGSFDSAIFLSKKASTLAASHQNWESYLDGQGRINYALYNQGKYRQCVQNFHQLLDFMDSLQIVSNEWQVVVLSKLAMSYHRLGQFDKAIEWHQKRIYETKYPKDSAEIDSLDLARAYNNIGGTFQSFHRYEMADIYYDSVLNYLIQNNGLGGTFDAVIYGNKGTINQALGFTQEAEKYYRRTLQLIPAFKNYTYGIGQIYLNYASFLAKRNRSIADNQKAEIYCDSAINYLKNSFYKADCYVTYATIYEQREAYSRSIDYVKKAIAEASKNLDPSHAHLLEYQNKLATLYIKSRKFSLARELIAEIQKLKKSTKETEAEFHTSDILLTQGDLLLAESSPLGALEKYQDALKMILPKFQPTSVLENPERTHLVVGLKAYTILNRKIDALKRAYEQTDDSIYLKSALVCYDLMTKQVQLNTYELVELQAKLEYRDSKQRIYIEAITTALTAYEKSKNKTYLDQAFNFSCLSKASQIREQARESAIRFNQAEDRKNHAVSENMSLKITSIEQQLYYDNLTEEEVSILKEKLFREKELYRIHLQKNIPEKNYLFEDSGISELLQEVKRNQTLLLDFFELPHELVVFFGVDKIDFLRIPLDEAFRTTILNYTTELTKGNFDHRASKKIHDDLLEPILRQSGYKGDKLLIIPSECLSKLSFESLATKEELTFLVEDYEISYNYSAFLAIPTFAHEQGHQYKFSGFSPYKDLLDNPLDRKKNVKVNSFYSLSPLIYAEKEVMDIAKIMSGKDFLGEEANEFTFRLASSQSKIIHLATHLLLEKEQPLYSRLVLSPSEDKNDGLLHAFEIYNMDISADLVTLGTCNSGAGTFSRGEGVLCLANSFLYAGSKNVVNSLWPVPDKTSGIIITDFYKYLAEGKAKRSALRLAKLDYLKNTDRNTSNPYFWSGFVLIGELEKRKNDQGKWQLWTAIIALLLFLAILIVNRRTSPVNYLFLK